MRTSCWRQLLLLLLFTTTALAFPWKPDISAGGSVAPARSNDSVLQRPSSIVSPVQDETILVAKKSGEREPFDQAKVS